MQDQHNHRKYSPFEKYKYKCKVAMPIEINTMAKIIMNKEM